MNSTTYAEESGRIGPLQYKKKIVFPHFDVFDFNIRIRLMGK